MAFLAKKKSGASLVEAAFITPIFLAIIFYIFELMFVNSAQNALLAIAAESSRHFAKFCNTSKFPEFIAKYKDKYAPHGEIKYYINVYENIDDINTDIVKCGEEIFWPTDDAEVLTFIDKNGNLTNIWLRTFVNTMSILKSLCSTGSSSSNQVTG